MGNFKTIKKQIKDFKPIKKLVMGNFKTIKKQIMDFELKNNNLDTSVVPRVQIEQNAVNAALSALHELVFLLFVWIAQW